MEEFDFIVVGGGPGGCVTASRLTEDPNTSVVLLEAGPDRRGFLADNLAMGTVALTPRRSSNNWGFHTVPDPGLNGRRDYHPLGRGLGGGTSINTLVYMRGHRADYDEWAELGNPGWAWDDVLPYFKKLENNRDLHDEFHGNDGPMWVENLRSENPWQAVIHRACAEAGWPYNPDFNGAVQDGYNTVQVMTKDGERWHTGKGYIHPHLGRRPNLQLQCDSLCTRVLFDGRRATGVEVVQGGQRRVLRARREVLVCGGGLLSAKLLMLSGVGPGAHLQQMGIPVVHDSPAVGRHLADHADAVLGYHVPGDPDLLGFSPTGALAAWRAWRRWKHERRGMMATNFAEVSVFMRVEADSPRPEIQSEFVIALAMDHGRKVYWRHGISIHVLLLNPKSTGVVKLASPDPMDEPVIDFRYFSHPDDLPTFVKGIRRTDEIMRMPALGRFVKRDLLTADCHSDEDWAEFARNHAGTNYHPVSSCRMGPDPADNVVDSRLRVHGLQGLRVVDSSIMPRICRGNTMAPAIMIGEKGSDLVNEDWR